ncbi:MAG: phosphoribosylformylglycinamidine cyclo-ligase [Candidatus Brocadiae bacterium]|nr:phosphoribosylformylglycinamidine cyclo-ligase [Candidatus Brocadiia bacterium]
MSPGLTYRAAGVDIDAGNQFTAEIRQHLKSTYGPQVIDNQGGFAGLYSIPGNVSLFAMRCKNPVLVAGTDGVGTKLKVAQRAGVHDTVGIDLVAMCVNDILVQGALPLFFLDYLATGKLDPRVSVDIIKGVAEGCRQADCACLGGETAEMPGFYGPGEYDLAGFAVGMVERARMLDGRRKVKPGDVVLGLASAGVHSNGYSLVRKLFFEQEQMPLDRLVPELGCTLGDELLKPTRIYVRSIRSILAHYRVKGVLHALAHITGGGLVENLPRVLGPRCVAKLDKGSWPRPPIFALMQRLGRIDEAEMFRVFNMGIGMAAIVSPYYADAVTRRLERHGEHVAVLGEVVRGDGPAVEIL